MMSELSSHPILARRFSCQEIPNGNTGYDHQYQGFNMGTLGNVITLFGPHGTTHSSFKSAHIQMPTCSLLKAKESERFETANKHFYSQACVIKTKKKSWGGNPN